MATLTQRDVKTLMPGSKNIQKRIQCVKAFNNRKGHLVQRSPKAHGGGGGGDVGEWRGGKRSQQNHISLSVCPPCVPGESMM